MEFHHVICYTLEFYKFVLNLLRTSQSERREHLSHLQTKDLNTHDLSQAEELAESALATMRSAITSLNHASNLLCRFATSEMLALHLQTLTADPVPAFLPVNLPLPGTLNADKGTKAGVDGTQIHESRTAENIVDFYSRWFQSQSSHPIALFQLAKHARCWSQNPILDNLSISLLAIRPSTSANEGSIGEEWKELIRSVLDESEACSAGSDDPSPHRPSLIPV